MGFDPLPASQPCPRSYLCTLSPFGNTWLPFPSEVIQTLVCIASVFLGVLNTEWGGESCGGLESLRSISFLMESKRFRFTNDSVR